MAENIGILWVLLERVESVINVTMYQPLMLVNQGHPDTKTIVHIDSNYLESHWYTQER